MRLGVLTGGGDCPGTNAVLRAITRKAASDLGTTVIGFFDAWDGVLEGRTVELTTDGTSIRITPVAADDPKSKVRAARAKVNATHSQAFKKLAE